MKQAQGLMQKRAAMAKAARVDDIPAYRWKSPLQQCVQILKRHRDKMFEEDSDGKPISIIVMTLAGAAYQGEVEIDEALTRILTDMGGFVRTESPRVPNPVNPVEDFADKWADPKYKDLHLEQNFWKWLEQAQSDFEVMTTTDDVEVFEKEASARFGVILATRTEELREIAAKKRDLLEKAAMIGAGAKTNSSGVIGSIGVSNPAHKFYGEDIHSEKEA